MRARGRSRPRQQKWAASFRSRTTTGRSTADPPSSESPGQHLPCGRSTATEKRRRFGSFRKLSRKLVEYFARKLVTDISFRAACAERPSFEFDGFSPLGYAVGARGWRTISFRTIDGVIWNRRERPQIGAIARSNASALHRSGEGMKYEHSGIAWRWAIIVVQNLVCTENSRDGVDDGVLRCARRGGTAVLERERRTMAQGARATCKLWNFLAFDGSTPRSFIRRNQHCHRRRYTMAPPPPRPELSAAAKAGIRWEFAKVLIVCCVRCRMVRRDASERRKSTAGP